MQQRFMAAMFVVGFLVVTPKLLLAQVQADWEGVPTEYRKLPIGKLDIPDELGEWKRMRPVIRAVLEKSLGDMPPRPDPLNVKTLSKTDAPGCTLEKFQFNNGVAPDIRGYLVIPKGLKEPAPAILAMHGHSPGSKESILASLLDTKPNDSDVAARLVKNGYVVMVIDAHAHGERVGKGPAGTREMMRPPDNLAWDQEWTLFKLNLLLGRTLWGMMIRDQQVALDYLCLRPEVDPKRIGATGKSMGSLTAWWLGAMDDRVKAVVAVGCSPRYEDLVATRGLGRHGIYYYVPGLLNHFDTEAIMGMQAPRPLLILVGENDAGAVVGIDTLKAKLARIYALYSAKERFKSIVYPGVGHVYLPTMKDEMLRWFNRHLSPERR